MPRNTSLDSLLPHHAFCLLSTLNRYYIGKSSGLTEGQEGELIGKSTLSLIYSLIEDYHNNGLYVRRKRYSTKNQGRPNWKLTITKRTPYPVGDSAIYLDTDTSRTQLVSNCETAKIHAQVIRNIIKEYGAILTEDINKPDYKLDQIYAPSASFESQLIILERELTEVYSERDMLLIKMLKAYIEGRSKNEGFELLVGTRKFHNVWEGMLDMCLPNKIEVNKKLPVPYYQKEELFIEVAQKGQRTDTVIKNKKGTYWAIIDAKYYNAASPNHAPGWHDLVKQYFYKTAAEKICNQSITITLHFIFPGTSHFLTKVKMGSRHQKAVSIDNFKEVNGYGEVLCHYCDPLVLLEKYSYGQFLDINDNSQITGRIFNS